MGVTQTALDKIVSSSLSDFDVATHIGFGTSNQAESTSDTDLIVPVLRKIFDETKIKNNELGTYEWSATMGLTEGNGNTIREAGLFDSEVGGEMFIRKLLNSEIIKTSSVEVSIGMKITITVENI